MNLLEFDSIEVSYDSRRILGSIYMRCEKGKITGLLGRNGSGKSTLMKVVFGSIGCEHKSVRIDGASLGINYVSRKAIAYLPQTDLIPSYLTIRKSFGLFGIDPRQFTEEFPEADNFLDLKPPELAGGYRRVIEMFLILRSSAPFCFLDEPFSGLSPVFIEKVKTLIVQAKATKGILISDHLYRNVIEVADDLYVLANAQTYRVSDPSQLIYYGYISQLD